MVIGLDAVRAWPLFYNPINDSLHVAPSFGRDVHSLGGKYIATTHQEGMARAKNLAWEALEGETPFPAMGHVVQLGPACPNCDALPEMGYSALMGLGGSAPEVLLVNYLQTHVPSGPTYLR